LSEKLIIGFSAKKVNYKLLFDLTVKYTIVMQMFYLPNSSEGCSHYAAGLDRLIRRVGSFTPFFLVFRYRETFL